MKITGYYYQCTNDPVAVQILQDTQFSNNSGLLQLQVSNIGGCGIKTKNKTKKNNCQTQKADFLKLPFYHAQKTTCLTHFVAKSGPFWQIWGCIAILAMYYKLDLPENKNQESRQS